MSALTSDNFPSISFFTRIHCNPPLPHPRGGSAMDLICKDAITVFRFSNPFEIYSIFDGSRQSVFVGKLIIYLTPCVVCVCVTKTFRSEEHTSELQSLRHLVC